MSHVQGGHLLEFQPYWTLENPTVREKPLGSRALSVLLGNYLILAILWQCPEGLLVARTLLWWGLYVLQNKQTFHTGSGQVHSISS